jgi:hypothetical protein
MDRRSLALFTCALDVLDIRRLVILTTRKKYPLFPSALLPAFFFAVTRTLQ